MVAPHFLSVEIEYSIISLYHSVCCFGLLTFLISSLISRYSSATEKVVKYSWPLIIVTAIRSGAICFVWLFHLTTPPICTVYSAQHLPMCPSQIASTLSPRTT